MSLHRTIQPIFTLLIAFLSTLSKGLAGDDLIVKPILE